jgi:hypothetical protein
MAAVDEKLVAALRQATAPQQFAFVVKGATDGALVVGKHIAPKDVADAKKACGGTTVVRGRCHKEEGKLVFEVPEEPAATLEKQIKTVIHRDAGLSLQVEIRVVAGLQLDGEAPPAAPPSAPPASDAAVLFAKRLKALTPAYQKAETSATAAGQQAKLLMDQAKTPFIITLSTTPTPC